MSVKNNYKYEIELKDGTIVTNHNNFKPEDVVRISFIPDLFLLPRHDIIFKGFTFVKRFDRVSMQWDSKIKERLLCVITDKFRIYIKSSNGQSLIVHRDYELYI